MCIFWAHSSSAGHFRCLHILAMVNTAAVNIGMRARVCVCVCARACASERAQSLQSCPTCDPVDHSVPGSSVHGILWAKTTGVGSHALLQGIFPTQRWNVPLLYCRHFLYC